MELIRLKRGVKSMKNRQNDRLESALGWCKKNKIKHTEQLSLFAKLKKKGASRAKKSLSKEEFEEMCKKAKVEPESLCKTIFTESLKSS